MSGQRSPRGQSTSLATTRDIYAPRGSILIPPGAVRAPLKSSQLRESALNVLAFAGLLAFITVTALALTAATFILLFVRL